MHLNLAYQFRVCVFGLSTCVVIGRWTYVCAQVPMVHGKQILALELLQLVDVLTHFFNLLINFEGEVQIRV